jgi:hypothetical protein
MMPTISSSCGRRLRASDSQQFLRRGVQVHEASLDVGGDDCLRQRLQREHLAPAAAPAVAGGSGGATRRGARRGFLGLDLAGGQCAQLLRRDDLDAGHQQRRRAFEIDGRGS